MMTADDQPPLEAAMAVLEDVVSRLPIPLPVSYQRLTADYMGRGRHTIMFEGVLSFDHDSPLPALVVGGTVLVDFSGLMQTAQLTIVRHSGDPLYRRIHWKAVAPL